MTNVQAVISEGRRRGFMPGTAGDDVRTGISNGRLGMMLLVGTETILFSSFIGAYLVLRMAAVSWPPMRDVPHSESGSFGGEYGNSRFQHGSGLSRENRDDVCSGEWSFCSCRRSSFIACTAADLLSRPAPMARFSIRSSPVTVCMSSADWRFWLSPFEKRPGRSMPRSIGIL